MKSIAQLWKDNRDSISDKKLQQILSFTGEGKLLDGNNTSKEFRDFLKIIPNELLVIYAEECLQEKFNDSGLALQDIVNEIGSRLGFEVQPGVYRGSTKGIGLDGIWMGNDGHYLIIEVKTTDVYRINLDILNAYRKDFIQQKNVSADKSSILIIVGRQDTGDLEAQVRGSRLAWDIRLMSIDSLNSLLALKEKLNDPKTVHQIGEILKPQEYTRIDKLIELMFVTAKDLEIDEDSETDEDTITYERSGKMKTKKFKPVSFHSECAARIESKFNITLVKQSKSAYLSQERSFAVNIAVSKVHKTGNTKKYWFAYHPHQQEFLSKFKEAFVAFGCGSSENVFLVPFNQFDPLRNHMWTTDRNDRMYWHVVILVRKNGFQLHLPKNESSLDLEPFRI